MVKKMGTLTETQVKLREMVYNINTAALVEALFEMGINPDILSTLVTARYDQLRDIVFKLLGDVLASTGVQQQLPSDVPSILAFYGKWAQQGGLSGTIETSDISESGYTFIVDNCMFCPTRDILLAKHPNTVPPCFISSLIAGIINAATQKQASVESVEIIDGKCKVITTVA